MYAVATIPLIKNLPDSVTQVWYADDTSALGSIKTGGTNLPTSAHHLVTMPTQPKHGWLVTKDTHLSEAITAFSGSNVNVTSVGHTHLGVPLGTTDYINHSLSKKVDQWFCELRLLSEIAITQPMLPLQHSTMVSLADGRIASNTTRHQYSFSTPGEHHTYCFHPNSHRKTAIQ